MKMSDKVMCRGGFAPNISSNSSYLGVSGFVTCFLADLGAVGVSAFFTAYKTNQLIIMKELVRPLKFFWFFIFDQVGSFSI